MRSGIGKGDAKKARLRPQRGSVVVGLTSLIDFRILGPLEIVEHGRPVVVGAPKVRALLVVLLLHRGEVVSTDRLIDALWGDRASDTAVKTVQVYVSNLRKALGDGLLLTRGHGYVLQIGAGQVDADRFEALATQGRRALESGDGWGAGALLREALALWRGPPLGEFAYEEFARSAISRLEEARLEALEDRIDADLGVGELAGLVAELEALVEEHPLRERLQGQLMLALYRSGRQAEALEHYRKARVTMVEQLGLKPGPRLQELERAILAHDPALDRPPQATRPPPAAAGGSRRGGWLIAAAGAILLAALAGAAVKLSGSGSGSVRVRVPANSVAVIDPRGDSVIASVSVGTRPGAIAFGSGSVWVANQDDQTISRIDPATLQALPPLSVAEVPTGLAASSNAIWVAGASPDGSGALVSAINTVFDEVGPTERVGDVWGGGTVRVASQGDAVWVAPFGGLLSRLAPTNGRVVQQLDPNSGGAAIALGDGAVWLTDTEGDNVTRVDPSGLVKPIPVGNGPTGIAFGEGGVWVADSIDNTVVRIDPSTGEVNPKIPVGTSPSGVVVGAGSVWVADSGDGTVTRIDPRTDKVTARIAVGGSPQSLTVAAGHIFVTVDAPTTAPPTLASGGTTLRIEAGLDVDSMDPALAYEVAESWQLLYATCAKLLNYPDESSPAGSRLIPEVAAALPVRAADGRTYTFKIRPGFRFSPPSNQPVTAQTFKETIERTLNPRMRSPTAFYLADVVGAGAYMAGKTDHISGVIANGDTLTIHLVKPVGDFPTRIATPSFCAVPPGTPIDPKGVRVLPSAGPYYLASYTPGHEIVLVRNPNYHGSRPRHFARIEFTVVPYRRAVADVQSGRADYVWLSGAGAADLRTLATQLATRYGAASLAAKHGSQQYFVTPRLGLDFFYLNTHRPLFADARMRQAVNYAIDRRALADVGDAAPAPDYPTDQYLPLGMPGYSGAHAYPLTPNLAKARAHARGAGKVAVLYTCDGPPCLEQAQIIKTDLAAIGVQVDVQAFPLQTMFLREGRPHEPFDLGYVGWIADYPDPWAMLDTVLEQGAFPNFNDPAYQRRLARAALLSGPGRYVAYGKLELDMARNAAPLAVYGSQVTPDFFSARIGCQTFGVCGTDLAALCIKQPVP
jgi:YVTN family beta-propeller protein